jgi:hypothetical protein
MAEPRPTPPTGPSYEERSTATEQTSDTPAKSPSTAPSTAATHAREPEPECPECDLDAIDDLQCEAQRITTEASVTEAYSEELTTMRTEFEDAKTAYLGARADATIALEVLDEQIKSLTSSVQCFFDDTKAIECLEASYATVKGKLAECEDEPAGCCVKASDCEFVEDAQEWELAGRIDEYTAKVAKAKGCFDALKLEPTALPARVGALQESVSTLATDLCAEDKKGDWKTLYVRFLKVLDDRGGIWRGFDSVTAYVDCLCLALTCVLKGKKALAKLEGQRAYADCQKVAKDARCNAIRENIISEVIAEYERTCGKKKPYDQSTGAPETPDREPAEAKPHEGGDEPTTS